MSWMADSHPAARRSAASSPMRGFAVHLLTASGTALALLALLEAVREHWSMAFVWLGLALAIDGIDGPLARRFRIADELPNWSGETLDLVVDFLTYVFVPAYMIAASKLLLPLAAPLIGIAIVMSGALYFADRRMKTEDNCFRGFPALWNAAAFFLFLLKPSPMLATGALAVLVVLTFVPFRTLHPLRTRRGRPFTFILIGIGAALAVFAVLRDFNVPLEVKITLCAISAYVLFSDTVIRVLQRIKP
ncbi:CDP-alcohol phosphatidyltransferase [Afipia carboxidovorans OM5]|uniref:Phosphatidylcholine synthase n=1 Tax=Afipia carboxidovorans (strain ATCC 49405 / DSM 1227 / KCTC 32145 / OM5) TaxID=504832 RepID=F8BTP3_AFIC5|nr:CDP-alcohol phosphatidyltransferase family protein [Afipia carboxidovorans]AEI02967.1 CDP-alcohol phosphatidyltransferase [Afipia carboxidovorans OM4]AEI06543.1 CDP-alcohol phosphatidyltransferase [Afipia carboxidovorans OM5]